MKKLVPDGFINPVAIPALKRLMNQLGAMSARAALCRLIARLALGQLGNTTEATAKDVWT